MNCIKAALNDYGMSVADLSRESGVPYTTLNAMVTDRRRSTTWVSRDS